MGETPLFNTYTLADLVACAERELALRHTVYSKRVETGRMKAKAAIREIEMMTAIRDRLRRELAHG